MLNDSNKPFMLSSFMLNAIIRCVIYVVCHFVSFCDVCHLCWVSLCLVLFTLSSINIAVIYAECHLCWVSFMPKCHYTVCHLCCMSFILCHLCGVIYAVCHLCCVWFMMCHLCWVLQISTLCWVSLCTVLFTLRVFMLSGINICVIMLSFMLVTVIYAECHLWLIVILSWVSLWWV